MITCHAISNSMYTRGNVPPNMHLVKKKNSMETNILFSVLTSNTAANQGNQKQDLPTTLLLLFKMTEY